MSTWDPTVLNDATRFYPSRRRPDSRSPSRSPVRRAQFAAQQLDPLLGNLSPESTLKALKSTQTIAEQVTDQDVLTQSISDATTTERELGIRAAFAAQKVREWRTELASWKWPNKKDRTHGLGFLQPARDEMEATGGRHWLGSLPEELVYDHEERIEEIRDLLDSLDLDDIKDHVLQAHAPVQSDSMPDTPARSATPYSRMRDFTALITATVIQALPDLAHLHVLLDSWEVRCTALRLIPSVTADLNAARKGVDAAQSVIVDPEDAPRVTREEFEITKEIIGDSVSSAGEQIDKLLDILEGHGDALPQSWMDRLEKIELDYAAWVAAAEHLVMQNEARIEDQRHTEDRGVAELSAGPRTPAVEVSEPSMQSANVGNPDGLSEVDRSQIPTKPLSLNIPPSGSHKRGPSEVSMAESAMSGFSDISQAEIVDARRESMLPSPKISMIDNPFRASKDELAWFGSAASGESLVPPPFLQRASSISMEAPKEQAKRVTFLRDPNHETMSESDEISESTPSTALQQLTGEDASSNTHMGREGQFLSPNEADADPTESHRSSLEVRPLRTLKRDSIAESPISPLLPSHPHLGTPNLPNTRLASISDSGLVSPLDEKQDHTTDRSTRQDQTLEAKIQHILTGLPTRVRLTSESNASDAEGSSTRPDRALSPTPTLTLSPSESDRQGRRPTGLDSGVRVFHLTDSSHSRQPTKLFVRAVGENGDRVMVRVGGGWADLSEYLREYSAHHGSRGINNAQVEVAPLPAANNPRDSAIGSSIASLSPMVSRSSNFLLNQQLTGSPSQTRSSYDFGGHPERTRQSRAPLGGSGMERSVREALVAPAVIPGIPGSYTIQGPSMITTTGSNGQTTMRSEEAEHPTSSAHSHVTGRGERQPTTRSSRFTGNGITTTASVTNPPASSSSYTPLGAAGPVGGARRAADTPGNQAWVDGMVDRARAASGNSVQVVHGPTFTTTTTVTMGGGNRRTASAATPSQGRTLGGTPRSNQSNSMRITSAPLQSTPSQVSAQSSQISSIKSIPASLQSTQPQLNRSTAPAQSNQTNSIRTIPASLQSTQPQLNRPGAPAQSNQTNSFKASPALGQPNQQQLNHSGTSAQSNQTNSFKTTPAPQQPQQQTNHLGSPAQSHQTSSPKTTPQSANKNRNSLGDFAGIRRVFLRRKSDNRTSGATKQEKSFY